MNNHNNLKKILIVDDNIDIRLTLEDLLLDYGYEVIPVVNGRDALEQLKSTSFDLIISDILMPVMDGYQLLKNVKNDINLKNIPFVFFTGTYTNDKDKELGRKLGADEYIEKPLDVDVFIRMVQRIFEDINSNKFKPKMPAILKEDVILKLYSGQIVLKLEKKVIDLENEIIYRKKAEKALKESEEKLKSVLDHASDAIVLHDLEGKMLLINKEFHQRLGYTYEEAMQLTPIDIDTPEYAEKIPELFKKTKRDGKTVYETKHLCKNGNIIPIEVNACIVDLAGKKAIISIGRDISERKQAEEVMMKASRMEAYSTLASGIAHDFNNLMVAVLGNADLLKMKFNDPEVIDKLNIIANNARKAGDLSQQLLAFARGGKYHSQTLNLNDIILETIHLNERSFPKRVRIDKNLDPDLLNINADLSQMNYVIMNLCINSIEAIEKNGRILITTGNVDIDNEFASSNPPLKAGRFVSISVDDTGCGIDKDTLSKIFEPFFSTKFKGRGLGLAAIFGIIENHNGYISVNSKVGSGTTFNIYLPAVDSEKIGIQAEQMPGNDLHIGNETILIVDDEPDVLHVTQIILENFGYQTLLANNGQEALEIAKNFDGDIHLAILDMWMPVLDGEETFYLLKKSFPKIKIIICSGYELNEKAQTLLNSGAKSFIQKPFGLEKLVREVQKILNL